MKTILPWLVALLMTIAAAPAQDAAVESESGERHFESLHVGELAFTNVWVHRQTNFNILIRHSRGIHTIKLTDLPSDQLAELQAQIGELADVTPPPAIDAGGLLAKLQSLLGGASRQTLIIGGVILLLLILLTALKARKREFSPPGN